MHTASIHSAPSDLSLPPAGVPSLTARLMAPLLLAILFAGCGPMLVTVGHPRPNVMLPAGIAPDRLELGPNVEDTFLAHSPGLRDLAVDGWRQTLSNGFDAAFPSTGDDIRVLEIVTAELFVAPSAVNGRGETVAATTTVRFRAILHDPVHGDISIADSTPARSAATSVDGFTDNASLAVEAMYERIADVLAGAATAGGVAVARAE